MVNNLPGPISGNPSSTVMKFNYSDAGVLNANPVVQIENRDAGILRSCSGIAFDANQNLWIACQDTNAVVEIATGALAGASEVSPVAVLHSSSFSKPANVAFDNLGRLWVINSGTYHADTLLRFDNPAGMHNTVTMNPSATFTGLPSVDVGAMQFYPPPTGTGLR